MVEEYPNEAVTMMLKIIIINIIEEKFKISLKMTLIMIIYYEEQQQTNNYTTTTNISLFIFLPYTLMKKTLIRLLSLLLVALLAVLTRYFYPK
jgi:hypothetical protein